MLTLFAFALDAGAVRSADIDPKAQDVAALEKMAQTFGKLSAAELRMIEFAPHRELAWIGPSKNRGDPSNDPATAAHWAADRTIRARLLAWLLTDPKALQHVHPSGIGLGGARIVGPLDLSFLTVGTPLTLVDCSLPDGINLSYTNTRGLDFRRDVIGQIEAERATVHGDFTLGQGSYKTFDLFRAKVDGDLDLSGGRFRGDGQTTVTVVAAAVSGDALFHDGFESDGMIDFRLSTIGGSLSFNSARFIGTGPNGLNAERARVGGTLYWTDITTTPQTVLDLDDATVGALWDDPQSWPAPGHLMINGFVYRGFGEAPDDAATRLRWIGLQSAGYRPQPFNQLAEMLHNSGREVEAVTVLVAQRDARRRFGGLTWAERVWQFLLKITVGYGYRPLQALWWILGFVVVGTLLFGWGYRAGLVTPTEASAYETFIDEGRCPKYYPPFNAFVYSLENFLPLVDLHEAQHWRPNPYHTRDHKITLFARRKDLGKVEGAALRIYLWIHILAGWTLTPLFVAGITGLIHN